MNLKNERLKREICQKANLKEYESTVERIIQSIHDAGCSVSCCDVCVNSKIEQTIDGSFKAHLRIGFKNIKEEPIHYIWDILHEFGHYLSGIPNGKEGTVERENQAWDLAFTQLKKYPELFEQVNDFNKYKENCLMTYK